MLDVLEMMCKMTINKHLSTISYIIKGTFMLYALKYLILRKINSIDIFYISMEFVKTIKFYNAPNFLYLFKPCPWIFTIQVL